MHTPRKERFMCESCRQCTVEPPPAHPQNPHTMNHERPNTRRAGVLRCLVYIARYYSTGASRLRWAARR
eukprot:scaffold10470_cov124-Isochrysis_galbana.AAC.2